MPKSSAALATSVMDFAKAFLTPARGRHSARRQRSTRVRRYARTLPPASPRTTGVMAPERAFPPPPPPHRVLSPTRTPAEEPALVRSHHHAHEQELRRIQEQAKARLHAWTTKAPDPNDEGPPFTPVRHLPAPPVPVPRVPSPRVPAKFDQLPHLSRLRQRQRHRLTGAGTGTGEATT